MEIKYKKFNQKEWHDFGKSLLIKESSEQIEFLEICQSGKKNFLSRIDKVSVDNPEGEAIIIEHKFIESEFRNPPSEFQKIIWEKFKALPNDLTMDGGFWGYVVCGLIEKDTINPECLASEGADDTGINNIAKALKSKDAKIIDACVRRVLRSLCNFAPRGKRIIFDDFSLGKSYWRWQWADAMSKEKELGLKFEEILEILDIDSYSKFAEKMHTGKSYISSPNILGGLLLFLKTKQVNGGKLGNIISNISYLSAWKALEAQSFAKNKKEIEAIAKAID